MWMWTQIRDNTCHLEKFYNKIYEPDSYITILFTQYMLIRQFYILVELIIPEYIEKKCSFSILQHFSKEIESKSLFSLKIKSMH